MAFRSMRRFKQQLTEEACIRLLKEQWRGVLSVNGDDGYPYGVPVDFYYDEDGKCIYLHSAGAGHKADSLRNDPKVCFTIWDEGYREDGDWAFHINSVIVFGKVDLIEAGADGFEETLRKLGNKYYPTPDDVDAEISKDGAKTLLVRINIEHMTGKKIHEK